MVVQRQVAPQLRTGFTKGVHNFSDLADLTTMAVSWETRGEHSQLLTTHSNDNELEEQLQLNDYGKFSRKIDAVI